MICNARYKIINCVAKWPGSVHDSRIFRDSHISVAFENGMHLRIAQFLTNYITLSLQVQSNKILFK